MSDGNAPPDKVGKGVEDFSREDDIADFAGVDAVPGVDGVAGPGVVGAGVVGVPGVTFTGVAVPGAFTATVECEGIGEARDEVGCDGPGAAGDVITGDSGDPGVVLADGDDLGKGKEGEYALVDAECSDTGGAGTGEQLAVTAFVGEGDEGAGAVELGTVGSDIVESIGTLAIRLVAAGTED